MEPELERYLPTQPRPIATYRTKQEIVYASIKDWILCGALVPGERLTIREIAARLGVSETPVRGALTRLESEGLLEYTSHVGASVAPVRQQDIDDAHAIVRVLQGLAAARVAGKATRDEVAILRSILDELEALPDDASPMEYVFLNLKFHRHVSELSGYTLMNGFFDQLMDKLSRAGMIWMVPSHRQRARREHREVLSAIERRSPEEARACMEQHWLRSGNDFVAHMESLRGESDSKHRIARR